MDREDIENIRLSNQLSILNCNRTVALFQLLENADFIFKRKYTVRPRLNPFVEYDEAEFKQRYRLSKALVKKLYHLLDGPRLLEPQVNFVFFTISVSLFQEPTNLVDIPIHRLFVKDSQYQESPKYSLHYDSIQLGVLLNQLLICLECHGDPLWI